MREASLLRQSIGQLFDPVAKGVETETRAKARQRVARFYTDTHQREKLDALMREVKPDASHGG